MSGEVQTIVNAVLLLVVAFVGGTLGLRRFEAIERSIAELRTEMRSDDAEVRREFKADLAGLGTDMKVDIAALRAELAQLRSDVTYIGVAVGARRTEGSG